MPQLQQSSQRTGYAGLQRSALADMLATNAVISEGEDTMLRTVLGIVLGVIAATLLMLGLEALGMTLFPSPAGAAPLNQADLAQLVADSSPAKQAWVVMGWALASLVGGWVAARIGRGHPFLAALAIGVLITLGAVMNAMTIAHPAWMNLAGFLLPIPLALLGARIARPRVAVAAAVVGAGNPPRPQQ